MNLKTLSRALLYFTFLYNIVGFLCFAFPASVGKMAGLPAPPQLVYSTYGAVTILVWAFVYLYLARQVEFNRPLLWVGVVGKFNVFMAVIISWQAGEINGMGILLGGADLLMGLVWMAYLLTSRPQAAK